VAGYAHLNKLSATVRDDALARLEALLPSEADEGGRREGEALEAAIRDGVASKDPEFQTNALVAALSSIVESQQQQIDALKAKSKRSSSSSRATSSSSTKKK
jgi:hypothetical protein